MENDGLDYREKPKQFQTINERPKVIDQNKDYHKQISFEENSLESKLQNLDAGSVDMKSKYNQDG